MANVVMVHENGLKIGTAQGLDFSYKKCSVIKNYLMQPARLFPQPFCSERRQ